MEPAHPTSSSLTPNPMGCLSAHKAPEIPDWFAHQRRARWHRHFMPTSSSLLNLVERQFKELTDRRLGRSTFASVSRPHRDHPNVGQPPQPGPKAIHLASRIKSSKVCRGREALSQVQISDAHPCGAPLIHGISCRLLGMARTGRPKTELTLTEEELV
jgi:hypothetical protein